MEKDKFNKLYNLYDELARYAEEAVWAGVVSASPPTRRIASLMSSCRNSRSPLIPM